jgi:mono/diheme cytochrome c family protein
VRIFLPVVATFALTATFVVRVPATAAPQQQDAAAIYKRCAACHLATGAGIPGAFPPLAADVRNLSQSAAGRKYLALVVLKGVSGPLTVDGKPYRGVMPAQPNLNDAEVASVLNHVVSKVAKGNGRAFTVNEIAAARKAGMSLNAAAVGKLHASAGGK